MSQAFSEASRFPFLFCGKLFCGNFFVENVSSLLHLPPSHPLGKRSRCSLEAKGAPSHDTLEETEVLAEANEHIVNSFEAKDPESVADLSTTFRPYFLLLETGSHAIYEEILQKLEAFGPIKFLTQHNPPPGLDICLIIIPGVLVLYLFGGVF